MTDPIITTNINEPFDSGSTGFIILSAALVMLMTPGVAFFYGGLVNKNSVLNVMFQSFVSLILTDILWFLCAYSLTFSGDIGGVIGNADRFLLIGLVSTTPFKKDNRIPELVFAAYQMMFAIVCPALITGAFVNRIKFKAYLLFFVGWMLCVYVPWTHWIWGNGFLGVWGVKDFAGGLIVHELAGFAALGSVLYVGKRGNYSPQVEPHSIPLAALGASFLWFGWYGFNSGSALGSTNGIAALAFLNTDISGSIAAVVYVVTDWFVTGKPKFVGLLIGGVAGLVTITPMAGFVHPWSAFILGAVGSQCCYWAIWMKNWLGIDDALDVFSIHGIPGALGIILSGLFSDQSLNPNATNGLFYSLSGGSFFGKQLTAAIFAAIWSLGISYLLLTLVNLLTPVRATAEEQLDIDIIELGEAAYLVSEENVEKIVEWKLLPVEHWEVWNVEESRELN